MNYQKLDHGHPYKPANTNRYHKKSKMGGNTQVFQELPKPNFTTTNDASTGTKDDMFVKSFKEAVEGGIQIASVDMKKP